MLGFWNRSVYITYLGVFVSCFGLMLAINTNNISYSFVGMIIYTVCDMFDGKVARHIKNRTDNEKSFGVEIDSLADIVGFVAVPAFTLYYFGMREIYQIAVLALFIVSAVIRLGYFNVVMSDKDKAIDYYQGFPVSLGVLVFSVVWLLNKKIDFNINLVYTIVVPIVGLLHISKFKIKKYTDTWFYVSVCLLAALGITLLFIL